VSRQTHTGKQLMSTKKTYENTKGGICRCTVCFDLEAKVEHENTGKSAGEGGGGVGNTHMYHTHLTVCTEIFFLF
jgi:hypothetical protein